MTQILSDNERHAIHAVVAGDKSKLDSARAGFHRAAPAHGVSACVELQFMSEVLAPVPDLSLRAAYRIAVLRQQ